MLLIIGDNMVLKTKADYIKEIKSEIRYVKGLLVSLEKEASKKYTSIDYAREKTAKLHSSVYYIQNLFVRKERAID